MCYNEALTGGKEHLVLFGGKTMFSATVRGTARNDDHFGLTQQCHSRLVQKYLFKNCVVETMPKVKQGSFTRRRRRGEALVRIEVYASTNNVWLQVRTRARQVKFLAQRPLFKERRRRCSRRLRRAA